MNHENDIKELASDFLADNHAMDGVRFLDRLLMIAGEVGTIRCCLANDQALQFQIGDQPAWQIDLGRARSKIRSLCARLAILCKKSGDQNISPYGGKSTIKKEVLFTIFPVDEPLVVNGQAQKVTELPRKIPDNWSVSFHNTPSMQDFVIVAL